MTLGERCDEILRLIDETLSDLGVDREAEHQAAAKTVPAPKSIEKQHARAVRHTGTPTGLSAV